MDPIAEADLRPFEPLLKEKSIRVSKQRLLILKVLSEQSMPMNAKAIFEACQAYLHKHHIAWNQFWLSTVYRSLEIFLEHDLVESVVHLNENHATYLLKGGRHQHYAICTACRTVIPMNHCPKSLWQDELASHDFELTGHRVEIYGLCKSCRKGDLG